MRWPAGRRCGVDSQLVLATRQVLGDGVTSDRHARGSMVLRPAHRREPCLEVAVVAFTAVVLELARVVLTVHDDPAEVITDRAPSSDPSLPRSDRSTQTVPCCGVPR